MKLKLVHSLAFSLLIGLPARAQVQLFEADMSGVVPYVGGKWNQAITQWNVGLEYTIDGRISFGFDFSKPFEDTLSFDPNLKAYTVNPYAIFEFIEPDNLKTFSFAMRADFIHENTTKDASDPADSLNLNYFKRTQIGGGPIFALRIFASERLVLIPMAAYEFFYVASQGSKLIDNITGEYFDDNAIWHDAYGSLAMHYRINEFNGVVFEPKVTVQIGDGRSSKDLVNVSARLGYVRGF